MGAVMLSGILVGIMLFAMGMMAYLLFHKTAYSARFHVVLCLALLAYGFGYLMEINATDQQQLIWALRLANLGIPAIGPFFMLAMMQLCDHKLLKRLTGYISMGYTLAMFLIVFTNEYHHLYYTSYHITFGAWTQVTTGKGILYYLNQVVALGCVAIGYILLAQRLLRWTSSMRKKMILVFVGTLFTLVGNMINVFGLLHGQLDVTPFTFALTLLCFFVAVQHNDLYDITQLGADEAVRGMDDGMVVLDSDGGLVFYNKAAETLFPALSATAISMSVSKAEGWPGILQPEYLRAGRASFQLMGADGERYFRCSVTKIEDGGQHNGWSIVMRDMTETVLLTRRLEELADTDPLTKIYNRRHFLELLQMEIMRMSSQPAEAALILFDLDHFKNVNDTYGHLVGDETLIAVAKTVQAQLRTSDLFGRYGGEEFVIYCPGTCARNATVLAERIRKTIEETQIEAYGHTLTVHASLGVAEILPQDGVDDIINHADIAMYNAKREGRNRVVLFEQAATQATAGLMI